MDRIREKIRVIRNSVDVVDKNIPENLGEFKSLSLQKDGIYKRVETAIQSSYDICSIILKEESLRVPGDEESILDILVEEKILSEEVAKKLKDMKGFRNALSHKYGAIDDEKAYHNIVEGLEDFETFLEEIEEYMQNSK